MAVARRILVVDDNPKITEVLSAYLRGEGFDVETAEDGEAALEAVARQVPDLALLDVMLPGVDGIELTRRFQREHDLPVILVTARTEEIDRLIGLEVGADDYVSKPFSPREVVARVKAVLRRMDRAGSSDQGEKPLEVDGLVLDPLRREVSVDGRPVELTRTEFDMLATLASQPGRVFTRMQLMEAAQGDAYEGYERTVDAHVKNIRRKLGDDPRTPRHVQTVIGVGYKLERER
jgi:two-component system alkaline phosphatase synthesis response regulator PhoP